MPIDRDTYFDKVRHDPFTGQMSQEQVDGQNSILLTWESFWEPVDPDLRKLAYMLATVKWETASTMAPIEEYGKGSGHSYGEPDPETKQTYYGRGFVQLTWRENYARATAELALGGADDLEWHAERALDLTIATEVLFQGMDQGWFTGKCLADYFNPTTDDPKNARQIINGNDKDDEIAAIHKSFLTALNAAYFPRPAVTDAIEEITVSAATTKTRNKGDA